MRPRQLRALELTSFKVDMEAKERAAQPAAPRPNHKQRRRQAAFNRKLSRKLKKMDVPASLEVLPDGGIHVHVGPEQDKPEESE
jgi:hypothetical protein